MAKTRLPKKRTNVTHLPESSREESLLSRIKGPALSLDDIVLTGGTAAHDDLITLSGDDLARLLNFAQKSRSVLAVTSGDDVNLRLRGLAELFSGTGGANPSMDLSEAGTYFIEETLRDLAAKLETTAPPGQLDRGRT